MKCPFCGSLEDRVVDSRASKDGDAVRRRRECLKCGQRFTSYERVEDPLPMVIKKDGSREFFDKHKILAGLKKACEKRPIPIAKVEEVESSIKKKLVELGVKEIQSSWIGEEVMLSLKRLDKVAYVRFASVYRQFKDINDLMEEVKSLFEPKKRSQ
ncbi:transcriptional regulator NrdR [Thermodesulfovibrionales bacterium]|nr:transcriptional regulator NrdR [Thermodesulfovibrionales bacterium]MCL0033895.1 transcriptional regulator NrdR [Thermodesulfovibrionales bacterium]MCL0042450.1 transcriptional regulator NrdR [Thermodesulfovibrionales bacterium]MCL0086723.1 transcriptional regulator NrdR [Thermodesulfovibrionales bacterium]MCL0096883.1 transcriptional regulator NrdR [Thermodesulfovibrionales bacterium]